MEGRKEEWKEDRKITFHRSYPKKTQPMKVNKKETKGRANTKSDKHDRNMYKEQWLPYIHIYRMTANKRHNLRKDPEIGGRPSV